MKIQVINILMILNEVFFSEKLKKKMPLLAINFKVNNYSNETLQ